MGKKRVLVGYGVDIDAVAGWLGSYKGEDSTSDISRGLFAGSTGVRRLLKLFDKYNQKATWFIPGHSLETFPEECRMIRDAGHEIGLHGYSHENPTAMTLEQQRDVLDHTYKLLTEFCGKPPRGSVAPWWECSKEGAELLLKYGIEYDHSMSHEDHIAYWLRTGDEWTKIDYEKKAEHWMKPLVRGQDTGLVEIPAKYSASVLSGLSEDRLPSGGVSDGSPCRVLHVVRTATTTSYLSINKVDTNLSMHVDDLPPMMFMKAVPNSHGFVNPRDVFDMWQDHFDYFYREYDEFIFPMTIHPDVSGRPHVLLAHERLIEHINKHEGVEWVTFSEMCDDFKSKNKPAEGALMPATQDEVKAMLAKGKPEV